MMFEEITASSLVKVDMTGAAIGYSPFPGNPAGFTIHSAAHEVREDTGCVMHLHTPDGTAVSTSKEGLPPLNQAAQLVIPDLASTNMKASLSTLTSGRGYSATSATRTSCCCITTAR